MSFEDRLAQHGKATHEHIPSREYLTAGAKLVLAVLSSGFIGRQQYEVDSSAQPIVSFNPHILSVEYPHRIDSLAMKAFRYIVEAYTSANPGAGNQAYHLVDNQSQPYATVLSISQAADLEALQADVIDWLKQQKYRESTPGSRTR